MLLSVSANCGYFLDSDSIAAAPSGSARPRENAFTTASPLTVPSVKVSIPADSFVNSSACLPDTPPSVATVPASSRVLCVGSPRSFASCRVDSLTLFISPSISAMPC